jgi:ABC-type nickel/cobalt efflux system permease component RcnA
MEAAGQTSLVPPAGGEAAASAGPWQEFLHTVHDTQRELHRRLAGAVRALKSGGAGAVVTLLLISLLYGVFHAVGPGHGKAVISAYLLANERALRRGVGLAFLASLVQGLSAVLLVALLAVLLGMAGLAVTQSTAYLESASYALVALVGVWMLWSLLRPQASQGCDHGHAHGHAGRHDCGHSHAPDPHLLDAVARGKGLLSKSVGIVLAVGIRPCSGAVLVLLFALAHGVFPAGIAATFAMSLGTAVTVSLLAVMTVASKRLALTLVGTNGAWVDSVYRGLGFLGAGILLLLGLGLFWASLGPAGPL